MTPPRCTRGDAGLAIGLAALATWMTWPLAARLGTHVYDPAHLSRLYDDYVHPDISLNVWILGWIARTLPRAPGSLFAGPIYYPAEDAIAYSDHMLGVAPLSLAAYWGSGGNAVFTHQFVLAASFVLAAVGMGLAIRVLTGSRAAAAVGGALFAFAPWRFRELFGVQRECTFYLPLLLLFVVLYLDGGRRRHLCLVAVCAAAQALSAYALGYPAFAAIVPFVVVYAVAARTPWTRVGAAIGGVVVGGLLTAALSGPYVHASGERVVPAVEQWAPDVLQRTQVAPLASYLSPTSSVWPGALPLALAAAGCAAPLLRAAGSTLHVRLMPLALGSLAMIPPLVVLGLGPHAEILGVRPLERMWAWVPGLDVYRAPFRFSFGLTLPLAVLGALAVAAFDLWLRRRRSRWATLAIWAMSGALVAGICWLVPHTPIATRPMPPEGRVPGVYAWLAAQQCEARVCPVLEVPAGNQFDLDPRYVYWTLTHGHPAVNGYSGYAPAVYPLVVGLADQLPSIEAGEVLARLTAMRWIVVHRAKLTEEERHGWDTNGLVPVATFDDDVVYEAPSTVEDWRPLYLDPPENVTFADTPLAPLPALARGDIRVVDTPGRVRGGEAVRVTVLVRNDGDGRWPSLSHRRQGRVSVSLRWSRRDGGPGHPLAQTVVLPVDLAPGSAVRVGARVAAPPWAGGYTLEAQIVQDDRMLATTTHVVDVVSSAPLRRR